MKPRGHASPSPYMLDGKEFPYTCQFSITHPSRVRAVQAHARVCSRTHYPRLPLPLSCYDGMIACMEQLLFTGWEGGALSCAPSADAVAGKGARGHGL